MSKTDKKEIPITPAPDTARIIPRPITDEMQESYLDYAMSVIIARALPDVRDGLKPVHRRILYAMWNMGLKSSAKFRKSAHVVGEVMAKYHPHGDSAIYDSLVRMAQDFAMRAPLIRGQGNFGSMDGDAAAAMRYTESKLAPIAEELLLDIDKETVPFAPNYDGTHNEPTVLPARLPNLLVNGTVGIAVGMATNIPPHNIGELCDAIAHLIDRPDATVEDLMEYVKGPDFPTGGTIYSLRDIQSAYATGRGSIAMRAKSEIEEDKNGVARILFTEMPYQVNKATVLEKIGELVRDKRIEGIKDLRDESSKGEVRVVVELKKDAFPKKVLNQLFEYTQLQDVFHVNMLALVDGLQPRVLTLKTVLEEHVKHRRAMIIRRTTYDRDRAKDRAHILEGLVMALEKIDAIIATIKKSKDKDDAKINLIGKFRFTERQAVAILEMRLQQLANLERLKVEEELREKEKFIAECEALLASPKKILGVVKSELAEVKAKYATSRKTAIVARALGQFSEEDLIPNESAIVMMTRDGYIKRLPADTFRIQGRGGKGVVGLATKEEDTVATLFAAMTHAHILFFTTRGRVFRLKVHELPQASRTAKGQSIVNFLELAPGEKVSVVLSLDGIATNAFLTMVTRNGLVKRVALDQFSNVRRNGLIAIRLKNGDELEWVQPSSGNDDIVFVSRDGQAIRFHEKGVRAMGRVAAGVRGMRLGKGDVIVGMGVVRKQTGAKGAPHLLTLMESGYGKRTALTEYKVQGRGGSGIKTAQVSAKTGKLVAAMIIALDASGDDGAQDVLVISEKGQVIRTPIASVSMLGRATQGVRVMRFKEAGDKVANATIV